MSVQTLKRSVSEAPGKAAASKIAIADRQRTRKVNLRLLKEIAGDLLADLKIQNANLGINLVAAPEMTSLNATFLQHKGPTDVIAFDYANTERETRNVDREKLHGEIFVCVDEALVQAKKFKTTWQSEVVRYLVHGILHLLGHSDVRVAARRRMKREEDRRLRRLARRFSLAEISRAP